MCRPDYFSVSNNKAEVPPQSYSLHSKTADLLICELTQSSYNQKHSAGLCLVSNIFATTVTPFWFIDAAKNVIWNNRNPQSIRFCGPLKLKFEQKSKDCILKEDEYVKNQIYKLVPCKFILIYGKLVYINFNLYLIVIDDKVVNALTGTNSTQACPICGATPCAKPFSQLDSIKIF